MATDAERQALAERLWQAQIERRPCEPLTQADGAFEAADAYDVQRRNVKRRLDEGRSRRIVGRKVGLTSKAIQSWLGVDRPDFGALTDDMALDAGGVLEASSLLQPRAEAEIAFVLAHDLDQEGVTTADVLSATAYLLPAIEIIDSRVRDWKITFFDTVADNASSAAFVLGNEPVPMPYAGDLRTCGMTLRKNGRVVLSGAGAACLDHPVNAVAWLARTLVEVGDPLRAGDVVLSGALGPVTELAAGDSLVAEIARLGRVHLRVR